MARLHPVWKTLQIMVERAIAESDAQITVVQANQSDPETPESSQFAWCRVAAEIPDADDNLYVKSSTGAPVLVPCRVEIMLVVPSELLRDNAHVALDYAQSITELIADAILVDSPKTHQVDFTHCGYKRFIHGTGPGEGADRLVHIVVISASGLLQRVA